MLAPGKAGGGKSGALLAAVAGRGLSRGNRFPPEWCVLANLGSLQECLLAILSSVVKFGTVY